MAGSRHDVAPRDPANTYLTGEQLEEFARSGRVCMTQLLSSEQMRALTRWVDDVATWAAEPARGLHHREETDAGPVLARSEYFVQHHGELDDFIRRGPFAPALGQLFDAPPALFKEKINFKHPGGGGFAAHQDATAYRFVDHHISAMVPVDPATISSGCLWFADGRTEATLATDGRGRIRPDVEQQLNWVPVEAQPGDVVLFDSYAPHRSGTNSTSDPRRILYLTYNSSALGDFRSAYYADKLAEFEREGDDFDDERVRMSINDDFLGRPVGRRG